MKGSHCVAVNSLRGDGGGGGGFYFFLFAFLFSPHRIEQRRLVLLRILTTRSSSCVESSRSCKQVHSHCSGAAGQQ